MKTHLHLSRTAASAGRSFSDSRKVRLRAAASLATVLTLCVSVPAAGQSPGAVPQQPARPVMAAPPAVGSATGILVDGRSGNVLWAKDDRQARAPASLTKILTALIVLENADLASPVTITQEARGAVGSRTYAEAGWNFRVEDLLYGLLLPSGNDAAIALAQAVSPDGTVAGFMKMVNRRAAEIGATSTHLKNPHGLDEPGHMTTARDMALISLTALRNPKFAAIVKTQRHRIKWGDGTARSLRNHNKLLARYPGTIGVKTGYTNNARHTLVSAVRRNGTTLLAVTLGASKQYDDSVSLFEWGFANLAPLSSAAHENVWPPKPTPPQPKQANRGLDLIGDTLRLLRSAGGSSSTASGLGAPLLALTSLTAGSLGVAAFSAVRSRRRVNHQPAVMSVHIPASSEVPYVSQ